MQWDTDPLSRFTSIEGFSSKRDSDLVFGACKESDEWCENGIVQLALGEVADKYIEKLNSAAMKGFLTIVVKKREKEEGKKVDLGKRAKLIVSLVTEIGREQEKVCEVDIFLVDDGKEIKISERFVQDLTNLMLEMYGVSPCFGDYQLKNNEKKPEKISFCGRNKPYEGIMLLQRNLIALGLKDYERSEIMDSIRDTYDCKTAKREKDEAEKECTITDIIKTKNLLKGLIVSIKDKNKYQLYVECPIKYLERLERNTTGDVFDEGMQYKEAVNEIKRKWAASSHSFA